MQVDEHGMDRPVSYFSKQFDRHQLNYSVIEKEALALIWGLQHFAVYVGSGVAPVVVYTDHNPQTFLHTLRCPNQKLIRWSLFLQAYDLDIRHIKGRDNLVADALSRCGIPPLKPRPGWVRGTVVKGVYRRHPPAGDREHPVFTPNQRDGGHLAAGRRKTRNRLKRDHGAGAGTHRDYATHPRTRGSRRP
jgi:hypothetical protein